MQTTLMPWLVKPEHRALYPPKMLRLEMKRRAGRLIEQHQEQALDQWLKRRDDEQTVVAYDTDSDEGWFYVPRVETDADIIREPRTGSADL